MGDGEARAWLEREVLSLQDKDPAGASPGYLPVVLDRCELYSILQAGKLGTDPAEELDLAQLGLMTCMDLAVPWKLSPQVRVVMVMGSPLGMVTHHLGVVTHPNLLLSHFGTIVPSHGTHIPGEVSGCRGTSWGPAMLRAGRSPWHLFGPPV